MNPTQTTRGWLTDEQLAEAACAGDRSAMHELLGRSADVAHGVCRRVCRDRRDAEDATQDTLTTVFLKVCSFEGRSKFSTWLHAIAVRAALKTARHTERAPTPVDTTLATGTSRAPGLAETLATRLDVDAALARLAPDFRAAIILRDQLGFSYAEIARVLDLEEGTVKSRIFRGRQALASMLRAPTEGGDHG